MIVERHSLPVDAPPGRALAAMEAVTLAEVPVVRLLFRLRGIPRRATIVGSLEAIGFEPVSRAEDELVYGLRRGAFAAEARLRARGGTLSTETDVRLATRRAAFAFRVYWLAVRPFSGLVRRHWLRAAKRRAEA